MASTESSDNVPHVFVEGPPSPFGGIDRPKGPHTSISDTPEVSAFSIESTAARRRRHSETQELKTKVELLGTKVYAVSSAVPQ